METRFSAEQLADPAMAASEQQVRKCVHCGFCNATCPTYLLTGDELDGPRGRIYLMKDMLENERVPSAEVVRHLDRCLSCLSCVTTCPSGVDYRRLIDHARAYVERRHRRPLADRVYRAVLAAVLPSPGRFRAAIALAGVARPFTPLLPRRLKAMIALAPRRPPASAQTAPFHPAQGVRRGRVVLLQGCAEPVLSPQVRAATIRLLTRAGFEVALAAGEGCCGALVHHLGREEAALDAARRNIDAWTAQRDEHGLDAIVVTASGCGAQVKDYGFMLRHDPAYAERAGAVSALAKDVGEVLDDALPPVTAPSGLVVAYHAPCSLQHGQKLRDTPRRLLTQAGFRVAEPADAHLCCGSAGTYNILQPEIAGQLRDQKAASLDSLRSDVIAAGNIGCAVQIGAAANTPVVHPVELLDWATGGPPPAALVDRAGGSGHKD